MKKSVKIITILIIFLILIENMVIASTLNLNIISDKEKVNVGEEITITVDWEEGMQAADFILNYDNSKFEFINIDIEDTFYCVANGQVKIIWISLDDTDKTSINLTFKALKPGKGEFSTEISGGFATGELEIPDNYNTSNAIVKVNGFTMQYLISIIIILVIIIIAIVIKKLKNKR